MLEAKWFPRACVASPHHLASSAGMAVLASGGNAVDAAVATNLTLGVVAPYLCGFGGDLFALVWRDGPSGYNGSGRAPAAATLEAVRAAIGNGAMPERGAQTVTVPGAVRGWFDLLERYGSMPFQDLARPALRYAGEGFVLSGRATASIAAAATRFSGMPGDDGWQSIYGSAVARGLFRQPGLARTIEALGDQGPDAYYRGPIAQAIADLLRSLGGLMTPEDLADPTGEWVEPLRAPYRDVEVLELPPNTQGVTALEALRIVDAGEPLPADGPERQHRLVEAVKLALGDRDEHVTDPSHMRIHPQTLLSDDRIGKLAASIDPSGARSPRPARAASGGTAYMCAADQDGTLVSLIQSNYMRFGSGISVPEWGLNLQNRGAYFSLDPAHINAIAPRKRTLHTLIPAMATRDGRPWLVFGCMGGDGQAQTHVQLLARIVDDEWDVQRAIDAPRWFISPEDWSVVAESRFDPEILAGLRSRGHTLYATDPYDSIMGHAHAILVAEHGYGGASDPRTEGAVIGI